MASNIKILLIQAENAISQENKPLYQTVVNTIKKTGYIGKIPAYDTTAEPVKEIPRVDNYPELERIKVFITKYKKYVFDEGENVDLVQKTATAKEKYGKTDEEAEKLAALFILKGRFADEFSLMMLNTFSGIEMRGAVKFNGMNKYNKRRF